MAHAKRKTQLSRKELTQLTLWGGLLLIILLVLVYGLVRAGAIIPVGSGVASHTAEPIHGSAPDSHP
jgi:predicted exporter